MAKPRLSPEKWIAAGLRALAEVGPQALAAEPLARRLGTTKGSFYWHFKDLPAYQAALLAHWQEAALADLAQAVAANGPPDQRLRLLGHGLLADREEAALRLWAAESPEAARALAVVDEERLTYIALLLRELGLGNRRFAFALQAALAGLPGLPHLDPEEAAPAFDTLVDTILALARS